MRPDNPPARKCLKPLRSVLCGDGTYRRRCGEEHFLAPAFAFDRSDTEPSVEENVSNLALPASHPEFEGSGRRSAGSDSGWALPATTIIYPLLDRSFKPDNSVRIMRRFTKDIEKTRYTVNLAYGLYINAAHGSGTDQAVRSVVNYCGPTRGMNRCHYPRPSSPSNRFYSAS
jgi:hypothetical protein